MAKEENIGALLVFGVSMIIVKEMIGKSTLEGAKLETTISIIKKELSSFVRVFVFHIKRGLNEKINI